MADASGATAAGQGTPAGGVQAGAPAQGGAPGQSTATGSGEGEFNWGLFPDVPEAQRELLQPHLKNVQGHVTRMEQQYAPYQGLMTAVQPDQVENLIGFLNGYGADPTATVLGMLQQEFQAGNITAEQLAELTGQQQAPAPGQQQQPDQNQEEVPEWARQIQARFEQEDAEKAQQAAQEAEQQLEQVMEQAKGNIRAQLTQGGFPEGLVTDEMIVAAVIANNGEEQLAANMFSTLRDGLLAAFTNGKTTPGAATVNGQLPTAPKQTGKTGDSFKDAKTGAKQMLEQQKQMAAA